MVCTKALGQEGAEQEEKRRPGCQKSQSDWKRGLRLEGSTESDHQSPGGHGEVVWGKGPQTGRPEVQN